MKYTNSNFNVLRAAVLGLMLAFLLSINAAAQFVDNFSTPVLDPAWTVVQTWPGGVPRAHGFTQPGNRYSLTDNPGFLRYSLDSMTHWDGFLNGYATAAGQHSCCTHDAGLEIHRSFSGDNWRFEAGGNFFLPFTNGRGLTIRIYFGTGAVPTYWVELRRQADVNHNAVGLHLIEKSGPALGDRTFHQTSNPNGSWHYGVFNYPTAPLFFRVERGGGVLTAYWSDDGMVWNTAWSHDLGNNLDGLSQRVVVAGLSWFNTGGSYADWDYISVVPTVESCDGIDNNFNGQVDEGFTNTDGDSLADCVDPDDDNDGVSDDSDAFPLDPTESVDTDGDSIGNNADIDDDNDGHSDAAETAAGSNPVNAASTPEICDGLDNDLNDGIDEGFANTDGDALADCIDPDDDNDGVADGSDNCPLTPNSGQADFDLDGIGDACDAQTGPPVNKDQCKNGGWARFDVPRTFTNQGDCIQFVNTGN